MYAVYGLAPVAALVVIDAGYLASGLGHPAGAGDYAVPAWTSSAMGIVAGALGRPGHRRRRAPSHLQRAAA
ncbi:hypothetical protein [Streptomyces sp. AC627_RSS907]|uniref:hypothetical protein n=1 Tax=Streptomyces sp. AC627_RSS907 TaxID=2823684 RepID=UPI001C22F6CE|nr:hypothetical protein [Streptomyces sp. AC627_RSS907]